MNTNDYFELQAYTKEEEAAFNAGVDHRKAGGLIVDAFQKYEKENLQKAFASGFADQDMIEITENTEVR